MTGLVLAVLTMGTFASLVPNGGTSLWLRSLGGIESLLSARLHLDSLPGFTRATLMTILTGLVLRSAPSSNRVRKRPLALLNDFRKLSWCVLRLMRFDRRNAWEGFLKISALTWERRRS
ncbi:hypothetical protein ACFSC4_03120 [Deinococcus malanensis]|uniref:hypothetical protein n=1 Tax=Deinococcus malanensis TaxID=1706855 RepID=UPI00362834E2